MEHDKQHLSDIEQELHDVASRLSFAYKSATPDRRLLENVLAKLPELSPAPTPEFREIESPYRRYFAFIEQEAKYLAPAVLVIVLVAVVSLRVSTTGEPTRLAQDTTMPEVAPMAVMVEESGPSLMMVSEPIPEEGAGARMIAPNAKAVPTTFMVGLPRDTRMVCEQNSTLRLQFQEPILPEGVITVTLDDGAAITMMTKDGLVNENAIFSSSDGYVFTLSYGVDGDFRGQMQKDGRDYWGMCTEAPVLE